jgi:phosphocarrier protein HPr
MKNVQLVIVNKSGLHARPASEFVKKAASFQSNITIQFNGKKINAKSIIAVLAGGLMAGSQIELSADGVDEAQAIIDLSALINSKFGE